MNHDYRADSYGTLVCKRCGLVGGEQDRCRLCGAPEAKHPVEGRFNLIHNFSPCKPSATQGEPHGKPIGKPLGNQGGRGQ